jgi:deazaflavin-dependent oxidoreductase (nitroreductase family)
VIGGEPSEESNSMADNFLPVDQPAPPRGLLHWLFKLPVYLYRAHLGFLFGHRFLVLVHEGRRSHRRYETPLEVIRYDRSTEEAIVAAGWGQKTSWLHNVEAGLARQVWIGRARFTPTWRQLNVVEAMTVFEGYERGSGIPQPIVRAVLSRLLGWRYDGSAEARRRAAEQLPMLGFRPSAPAAHP